MKAQLLEECMICFEETNHFTIFPCKHYVCSTCYEELLIKHPYCPLCHYPLMRINKCLECISALCCTLSLAAGCFMLILR